MPIWTSREPLQRLLQSVSGAMASVLFPGGCRLCEQLLTHALRLPICETSLASFSEIGPSICPLCGQPLTGFSVSIPDPKSGRMDFDLPPDNSSAQFYRVFGEPPAQ